MNNINLLIIVEPADRSPSLVPDLHLAGVELIQLPSRVPITTTTNIYLSLLLKKQIKQRTFVSHFECLQAVDLKSSDDFCFPGVKTCNEWYQVAVSEMLEILQSMCKTYGLPLALTWALCS
ncbi:PROTEIN NLP8 [Salix viminalis]|uniref:PROTEIN NLP8 n=1 Tax=Salix viminalis TaxID=40686 RepID=A0A9Q0USJ0_SALVM|nr:PROTEIN NLP8 [Salix viminalis]